MSEEQAEPTDIKVVYEETTAKYASQVILNSTREEIYLDFSSGIVPDLQTGGPSIPVHTRIAMSHGSARRLRDLLRKALGDPEEDS